MKKIFIMAVALTGFIAEAQEVPRRRVGINTVTPRATLEISRVEPDMLDKGQPQGVIFPHFTTAERETFTNITSGTLIFNTSKQCVEIYQNGQWACMDENTSGGRTDLTIEDFKFTNVNPIAGVFFSPTLSFKFSNNSFSTMNVSFPANTITAEYSEGITSVFNRYNQQGNALQGTAFNLPNLAAANEVTQTNMLYIYNNASIIGNGQHIYFNKPGKLKAKFNYLGLEAEAELEIGNGAADVENKDHYVLSMASPRIVGEIDNVAKKIDLRIPYKNGMGAYPEITMTKNAAPGQSGETPPITLKIAKGSFSTVSTSNTSSPTNGFIDVSIEVGGDEFYEVKRMTNGEEYTIASFDVDMKMTGGKTFTVTLKGVGGVTDRCYNKTTFECLGYGATTREHQFIYVPVIGPDGRTWLNNNLGAEYANLLNRADFNPTQQATSKTDHKAYGSLFQWQRKADGHELMNRTSATAVTPKYPTVNYTLSTTWDKPDHNQFIQGSGSYYSWTNNALATATTDKNLWQASGSNNPCPEGYHVPTNAEWLALQNAINKSTTALNANAGNGMYNDTVINLPMAGYKEYNNSFSSTSSTGYYWSSDQNPALNQTYYANVFQLTTSNSRAGLLFHYMSRAASIRCIKDL